MTQIDDARRKELLIALGNQPGVSAWFTVWQLSRERSVEVPEIVQAKGDNRLCPTTTS